MRSTKALVVLESIMLLSVLPQPVGALTFDYYTIANAMAQVGWYDSYFGLVAAYDFQTKEANNARSYAPAYFDDDMILWGDHVAISALADASVEPNEVVLSAEVTGSYEFDIGWELMEYFQQDANGTVEGLLRINDFPAGTPCSLQIDISFPNETWKATWAWHLYVESSSDYFVAGRNKELGDYGARSGIVDAYAGEEVYVLFSFYGGGSADHYSEALGDGKFTINTTLTATRKFMTKAYNPTPADGSLHNDIAVSLGWRPGDTAVSHNVYFGSSFDDVNDGTNGTFQGNQAATSFIAGSPDAPYPEGFIPDTTYYWRIDEVQADSTKYKGDIWSFRIPTRTAYDPNPADGSEFVELDVTLGWTAGLGAELHTVYFGDSFDDVNNATGGLSQESTTYTPDQLEPEKVYYWRVDEDDGLATYKGDVWGFTTPGAVGSPNPFNGAENVKQTTMLRWVAGDSAGSHQVYFGTDKVAVYNATTTSPEYKGTKNLDDVLYDPGPLMGGTNYYWRIDEVNNLNPNNPWKGGVWAFTTADYLVVDDIESYNNIDPPNPGSNTIFAYWIDGYTTPNINGALVGNDPPLPYTEGTIVHGGRQSMPYTYDINGKYAEATLTLDSPRDWTASDVKILTIWFHGHFINDAASIYVAIANITGTPAIVTHDDSAATQINTWTRWDIPLQEFADKGIDLMDVDTITIGIGNKVNPPGGFGKMYFDDIGLHPLGDRPEPEQ
jgi:hypothetical protein